MFRLSNPGPIENTLYNIARLVPVFFLTGIIPVTTGIKNFWIVTGKKEVTGIRREAPKIGDWNMTGILARSAAKK